MEKGLRRKTPIILRMALLAWVARRGTSVGGARELLAWAAGVGEENSMTKQSEATASSGSSFTGWMLAEEEMEEARAEWDVATLLAGRSEFDAVSGSSIV